MVHSIQGGTAKRAEALLHQVAAAKVAEAGGTMPEDAFKQIIDEISPILAKCGARSTLRHEAGRFPRTPGGGGANSHPELWLAAMRLAHGDENESEEEEEEEEEAENGVEGSVPTAP